MKQNIFDISNVILNIDDNEYFEDLHEQENIRIERIVSCGQTTPVDKWLEESNSEWVVVVQGEACLVFDSNETFVLKTGDHLLIPSNQKHRVSYTSSTPECIWIAVHQK
jgi:cupin 2 domain-containing protein